MRALVLLIAAVLAATALVTRPTHGAPVAVRATLVQPQVEAAPRSPPTPCRQARPARAGQVRVLRVPSGDADRGDRAVWTYTPDVPDASCLPVLYYLHGLPGSSSDLARLGLARQLDTLLQTGQVAPFVVAAPDGNATGIDDPEWADSRDGALRLERFVTEVLPRAVEGTHPRPRALRALAGFSMGGYGAMNLALRHPSLYGQVASFAGYFQVDDPSGVFGGDAATRTANSPDHRVAAAQGMRVLLSEGDHDDEPLVAGEAERFADLLRQSGVHPLVRTPDAGHNLAYVRRELPSLVAFLTAGWSAEPDVAPSPDGPRWSS